MTDTTPPADGHDGLDTGRIISTLEQHGVDYILVGGLAAAAHGATRLTYDFDCLADRSDDNLDRLASALVELGARYRVGGLTDAEARALPTIIDRRTLGSAAISTWRTDAGDVDVMTEMSVGKGVRRQYDELVETSIEVRISNDVVRIAALDDIIASKRYANRGKDQAALPELDQIARRQRRDLEQDLDGDLDIN